MKRYIFLVVAVALATVSCSKTYDTNKNAGEGMPISLRSWTNNLTRAREIGTNTFASGDSIFVYSYTSENQTPFEGTGVGFDGTNWTYSPLRFWDRNNDWYQFYAVSFEEGTALSDIIASYDVTDGTFQSKTIAMQGNNNDILVADSVKVMKKDFGKQVALNFRHINALFDLKVRKGAGIGDNGILKITAVSIENIDNLGTFAVNGYNADSALVAWTATGQGAYTDASGLKAVTTISSAAEITNAGNQYLIDSLVVMPQTFEAAKQQLKISYTITTGAGTPKEQINTFTDKTYDLILFDVTDYDTDDDQSTDGNQYNDATNVTGWVGGVHYIYIITIDAEAINFTASIKPWGTDNGYYYILN